MRVSILGGGAVGLGLGSCLAAAGAELHLQVRRTEVADTLRRRGLRRTGILGDAIAPPGSFTASTRPEAFVDFAPDWVLVCTKSADRDAAARWLADRWESLPGTPDVVLCLNGWGHAERFAERLPAERIFSAVVTTGFRRQAPNAVDVTVHGTDTRIGSLFGQPAARTAPLCDRLSKGGLPSEPCEDVAAEIGAKLLYNCALNPLAALLGVPYGALGEDPEARRIVDAVVREVFAVLAASGHPTRWPDVDAYLDYFFGELLPATRGHESSMLQDLRAGRATEIDAMSAAVVELGRGAGVPAPVNEALATLVRSLHPREAATA